jgi:hypothetical protein
VWQWLSLVWIFTTEQSRVCVHTAWHSSTVYFLSLWSASASFMLFVNSVLFWHSQDVAGVCFSKHQGGLLGTLGSMGTQQQFFASHSAWIVAEPVV